MTTIEKLLRLQAHDLEAIRAEDELMAIPRRRLQIQLLLDEEMARIESSKQDIQRAEAAVKVVETEVESCRDKIIRYRQQQMQIKTNTEYRALEDEITSTQEKIRLLEDQELVSMERADQARLALKDTQEEYTRHKRETDQELAICASRAEKLKSDVEELNRAREGLLSEIESVWLRRYERIFQHTRGPALVPVDGGACGGCHMKLTPQVVQSTRRGEDQVCCEYCGRILYALA